LLLKRFRRPQNWNQVTLHQLQARQPAGFIGQGRTLHNAATINSGKNRQAWSLN